MPFEDVQAFYRTGQEITLARLPEGSARVIARRARGAVERMIAIGSSGGGGE